MIIRPFEPVHLLACSTLLFSSIFVSPPAPAQTPAPDGAAQLDVLRRQIAEQSQQLDALKKSMAEQEARYRDIQRALGLDQAARSRSSTVQDAARSQGSAAAAQAGDAAVVASTGNTASRDSTEATARAVPQLFDQPGILTPPGKATLEPSVQYSYSSNNRVALVGYTVIPALLIGLVDVREVKRNVLTGALTGRFGLTNRMEVEARIPYVYRSDSTVSREIFQGSASDVAFGNSGKGIGDIEVTGRYQLNMPEPGAPYFIGSLRFKSRTGRDPFEVVTDCVTRCVGNTTGTGLPVDLPTGSGFYALQPGLTWLFPSDPAVFFGSFSYTHNFKRNNVSRTVQNGESEFIGTVSPGDILGVNFGMGLSLNDKSSFTVGFDLNSIGRTKQNGETVPNSVRTQLATMLFGYSYRYSDKTSFSVSVGTGLTRDTPDLTLNLRLPISF
ncbi:MAG: acetate kinase [Janthinobacterium lividum]